MASLYTRKIDYIIRNDSVLGFRFSLIKGVYNRCAIVTQVNEQASVARAVFAVVFGIFSTAINEIILEAQISEYNKKLSTTPNATDTPQNNVNSKSTAPPHSQSLQNSHTLSFFPTK